MVSTLSDAKIEEDAKQKKKWAVLSDRFRETWKAMNRGGKLEKQSLDMDFSLRASAS